MRDDRPFATAHLLGALANGAYRLQVGSQSLEFTVAR